MRTKRIVKNIVGILLIGIIYIGCTKDTIVPINVEDKIFSFSEDIKPIMDNNCGACHPHTELSGNDPYGFMTEKNWITTNPNNAANSKLYKKINTDHVKGVITDLEIRSLERWMELGAEDN